MPLPLPNLDTRRWADLVDESRSLIPRYAPRWTDYNVHDPGITLIELFAFLTEQLIYRANRVPDRHLRKFLTLAGFAPEPPRAAHAVLATRLPPGAGVRVLPQGVTLTADGGSGTELPFTTAEATTLVDAQLAALQTFDGSSFSDRTRAMRDGLAFAVFGDDPRPSALAIYLGADTVLPLGQPVSIHFHVAGAGPPPAIDDPCLLAPAARITWEALAADGWHTLDPSKNEVDDQTRAFTQDGVVRFRLPFATTAQQVGAVSAPLHWVRGRLSSGAYDAAPVLLAISFNAVFVDQLSLVTDAAIGTATGLPDECVTLDGAPIADGVVTLSTLETPARDWTTRADFDASRATDAHITLDPATGDVCFGDGVRGRVPPAGVAIVASYATTAAALGNLPARRVWHLVNDAENNALLGSNASTFALAAFNNASAASGGSDMEDVGLAASRAAASLWAHERLADLCASSACDTLDQLDHASVLACSAPPRATTVLDVERIALSVPGTCVRRARAWANLDPVDPCADAAGTVTLVIVPELPKGRPSPSAALLHAVRRWLDIRRVLCTRLLVVGPEYLDVSVQASIRALAHTDPDRVRRDVIDALDTFFDPLRGGPLGRGWPFGRDVYRSEVLAAIDDVSGVDHVTSLTLSARAGDSVREAQCGNLCVPPTWLVAPATHTIEVAGS